jgi:copper chaperone
VSALLAGSPASYLLSYHQSTQGEKLAEYTLHIEGMHCGACIRRVTQALASIEGTHVQEVRLGAARISSSKDPAPVDLSIATLAKAGYTARLEQ